MEPEFEIVPKRQAAERRLPRRERRDWKKVVESLAHGNIIFISDELLTEQDVKYLQLAFSRRGKGERLSTTKVTHKGRRGRQLEIAK